MSEQLKGSYENGELSNPELEAKAIEQRERIKEDRERRAEITSEQDVEQKKHEALEQATSVEKAHELDQAQKVEKHEEKPLNNKRNRDASFKKQMSEARREMSAPSRTFSKLIHNKGVEKVSEGLGSTIARPNAILSGSALAFLLVLALYLWARQVGYQLSGFETIGAFIFGWLLGIIFDFVRIMVTGKR